MSDTFDPDERFSLDEDPEDVSRKLMDDDEEETEPTEDEST